MKEYNYKVNGLILKSEIELPELAIAENQEPDVWIKIGPVPEHLSDPVGSGVLYEASYNDFLFKIDTVAKYRVQFGKYITIDPKEKVHSSEIRLFLFSSVMGALLHQRGKLAIHGSCVAIGNKGFIFTGMSSAGKSTIAAGLHTKGYSVISDDISVIETNIEKKHCVYPGIPHLKLWKDVLIHMDEPNNLEKVRPQLEKYKKPIISSEPTNPVLLDKIIVLTSKNTPGFRFEEIIGAEKFYLLRQNTYRLQFLDKLKQLESHFNSLTKLSASIKLYKVERPYSPLQIMELANFIESNILHI